MSEKRKKDTLVDSPVLQGVWDNLKKQPRIPHQRRQRKRSSAPPHPFNIHSDVPKNIKTGSFSFEKRTPSLERRRPKGLCLDMSLLGNEDDDDAMIREEKTAVDVGMNDVAMVLPHLFISGSGPAQNTSRLLDLGITHVINCCVRGVLDFLSLYRSLTPTPTNRYTVLSPVILPDSTSWI